MKWLIVPRDSCRSGFSSGVTAELELLNNGADLWNNKLFSSFRLNPQHVSPLYLFLQWYYCYYHYYYYYIYGTQQDCTIRTTSDFLKFEPKKWKSV